MLYKKTALLFILLNILYNSSCNNKATDESIELFSSFPKTVTLKSIKTNAKAYYRNANLQVFDSLLLLTTTDRSVNKKIHLYNKNTFDHIISTGIVGKGPGEMHNPGWNTWDTKKGIIWYPDNSKRVLWKFEIDSIINNPHYKPSKPFKFPSALVFPKSAAPYSGGLFSYAIDNPEYYFYVANANGKIIDSLNLPNRSGIYPDLNRDKIKTTQWYYYTIHPSKEIVFVAYHYADIIVGTDFKSNILFKKQGPDEILEDPKRINPNKAFKNERKTTYWCLRSDEEYVYCLYSGRNFFRKEEQEIVPQGAKTIFVFTWKGRPVIKIHLDRPATKFAIDKENDRIITFARDIGDLVYYNFSFEKLYKIQYQ